MRHNEVWRGIDLLAERNGLSASGLARLAGLDPTSFNPSKRQARDGRPRWPSTESIARALEAVGSGMDDFAAKSLYARKLQFSAVAVTLAIVLFNLCPDTDTGCIVLALCFPGFPILYNCFLN